MRNKLAKTPLRRKWVIEGVWKDQRKADERRKTVRASYLRHRAKNSIKKRAQYLEHRDMVRRLRSQPCTDCRGLFPWYVTEFDHARGVKAFTISTMVGRTMPFILTEIAKCDVVCANCHKIRTHKRRELNPPKKRKSYVS
jgi:hypothetical protein